MTQSAAKDPSTMAALVPGESHELRFKRFRNAMRTHGSQYMMLRRPSRIPEASREYVHGDPLNMIDWKAYARSDHLIVREIRDEASARVGILLDVSQTMHWPDGTVPITSLPPCKAEVAARTALTLAHLHLRMGDDVELWLKQELEQQPAIYRSLRLRSAATVISLFDQWSRDDFSEKAFAAAAEECPFIPGRSDVFYVVSDALDGADPGVLSEKTSLVVMLHVLSSLETNIDWLDDSISYFDAGHENREYQGKVLRQGEQYLQQLAAWRGGLEKGLRDRGGLYLLVTDRTPIANFYGFIERTVTG